VLVGDLFGPEVAAKQLAAYQRAVDRTPGAAEARFLDEQIVAKLHGAVWYCKGALALHALCEQLGDERFWSLLRAYTAEPTATTQGFAELLARFWPGPNTDTYLCRWFGGLAE
jgi:aminopeptidase N